MARKQPTAARAPAAPFIDRGEPLPRAYARNRIVPLVRDPEHIWIYWDVESAVRIARSPLLVRIHCLSEERHWDLLPGHEADNWYLRLAPDRTYRFELFEQRPGGLRLLAASREATTPVRWSGQSGKELPAEVIHAMIHPLARPAVTGAKHVFTGAGGDAIGAQHAAPLRGQVHAGRGLAVKPHRAPRHSPPSPSPLPVPASRPGVFSQDYSGGKGG